jgi:hypothetical protein
VWGFDETILEECGADCPNQDEYVLDIVDHVLHRYPNATAALVSHARDLVIRTFYGFGENGCSTFLNALTGRQFTQGLLDFRAFLGDRTNFGTYYMSGTGHTCLGGDCFYDTVVGNVALTTFVGELLAGRTSHIGPP